MALVAAGKFFDAYDVIRERCPLPAVCGRICNHPCQGQCNRKDIDEAVAVRDIKRFAADYVHEHRAEYAPPAPKPVRLHSEKIAIVGGGPAGLTAAHDLTALGYSVTLFEARPFLGGMLRLGVPAYRLPRECARPRNRAAYKRASRGQTQHQAWHGYHGRKPQKERLFVDSRFDRRHQSIKMKLEGSDAKGVMYGLDFLCKANLGETVAVGKRVLVIGGGNVAMDAARAALRLGASEVTVVYRRGRAEMPALPEEIEQAEEEGIKSNS